MKLTLLIAGLVLCGGLLWWLIRRTNNAIAKAVDEVFNAYDSIGNDKSKNGDDH